MLNVENLHFRYSNLGNPVLKGACLKLKQGQIGIVLGKNGSGKTTLFKNILGIEKSKTGTIAFDGEMLDCQRPLRAQTMQGERVSLASSDEVPAGAVLTCDVECLDESHEAAVREWLDYGSLRGLGQWRNSGKGRFEWEELDDGGKVIGGNKA